jgi:hypothetical protein
MSSKASDLSTASKIEDAWAWCSCGRQPDCPVKIVHLPAGLRDSWAFATNILEVEGILSSRKLNYNRKLEYGLETYSQIALKQQTLT